MTSPTVLAPATPVELITHILADYRYPTTMIIVSHKQPFLDALTQEIRSGDESGKDQLLHKSLLQTAVSRHLRLIFTPTITHLRAYLETFNVDDNIRYATPANYSARTDKSPLLLVYGFLEGHRVTTEWSAQGLASTAAGLVEAAARNSLRAGVVEPRAGGDGFEILEEFMNEQIPILNGTTRRESGAWSGRTIEVKRVLGQWFETPHEGSV